MRASVHSLNRAAGITVNKDEGTRIINLCVRRRRRPHCLEEVDEILEFQLHRAVERSAPMRLRKRIETAL